MAISMEMDVEGLVADMVKMKTSMEKAGFDFGTGRTVEGNSTPVPTKPFQPNKNVQEWLKLDNLRNTVGSHDDLIRELMTRQDRQAKWILFLLVSWVFSGVFLALAMMMG